MDLLQKMFLLVGHETNVIYSKLVNNPFNDIYLAKTSVEHYEIIREKSYRVSQNDFCVKKTFSSIFSK